MFARPEDPLSVSVSYTILRNGIGVLGMALPCVLVLGGGLDHVQGSLSAYYHFAPAHPAHYGAGTMRDVFVGMLCTIGAFLFFYRGHTLQEDLALNVAGICAVLIALFPMDWPIDAAVRLSATGRLHSTAAILFFVTIAFVLFRVFDIVKPPPIRHYDAKLENGFGVMLDDLLAAGYTLFVLALLRSLAS